MEISGQQGGDSAQPLTIWSAAEALAALPEDDTVDSGDSTRDEPTPETAEAHDAVDEFDDREVGETPEASDDDEGEAAPDDVEESDDEEEQEPVASTPSKLKAKVNGEEIEITPEEAVAGYQRQQDYSRKTMELAEAKKKFEAEELNPVRAERQQLHTALTKVEQYLAATVQEPDWDSLAEDPATFAQVRAAWDVHQERLAKLQQQRQILEQRMLKDAQEQQQQLVVKEREALLAALPEWKDPEVSKKEAVKLFEYATSHGVTAEEMNTLTDHRMILVLRKAMLFDEAQAKKAEAAKKAAPKIEKVKVAPPGPTPKSKPKVSELTRRKQRLAKTHSRADAAAALELMPEDDE